MPTMTLVQALAPYNRPAEGHPQRQELAPLVDKIHSTADPEARFTLIKELRSKCKHMSGSVKVQSLFRDGYRICPICNSIV